LRFTDSYTSLLLGILVVIIVAVLVGLFIRNRHTQITQTSLLPTKVVKQIVQHARPAAIPKITQTPPKQKTYTVEKGDNLWQISEKTTGSGYNWKLIAQANNITTPGIIFSGTQLIIPNIPTPTPQMTTVPPPTIMPVPNAITGYDYAVQKGDTLWDIAVRAYGDGFKWGTIATANNLTNPSVIHSGNVLKIPRPKIL